MQKIFLVIEKYFTIRVEKNFIRKILVDDIVFKLKTFSYIKTFFSNIVSSVEIKAVSEVKKKCSSFDNKTMYKNTLSKCPGGHQILYRGLKLNSKNSAKEI